MRSTSVEVEGAPHRVHRSCSPARAGSESLPCGGIGELQKMGLDLSVHGANAFDQGTSIEGEKRQDTALISFKQFQVGGG